jgi:hypothetical protein
VTDKTPHQVVEEHLNRALFDSFNHPFKPLSPTGHHVDQHAALRAAHALEYLAAQFGQLNDKLEKILANAINRP